MKNYYKILDIDPNASREEIMNQYKFMAFVFHPDRFSGNSKMQKKAEEKLKTINEAKDTLCNPGKRSAYDKKLEAHETTQRVNDEFWQDFIQQAAKEYAKQGGSKSSPGTTPQPKKRKATKQELKDHLAKIENLLDEMKWREAKEELSVFEDLGKTPKKPPENVWLFCGKDRPEWKRAERLEERSDEVKDNFIRKSALISLGIYLFIGIIWAIIVDESGGVDAEDAAVMVGFGAPFVGSISTLIYGYIWSGRWGKSVDYLLGILAGVGVYLGLNLLGGCIVVVAIMVLINLFGSKK
jgi:curved DNA-binding protein CbpA